MTNSDERTTSGAESLRQVDSRAIEVLRFPLIVGVVLIHARAPTQVGGQLLELGPDAPWACWVACLLSDVWARVAVPVFFLFAGFLLFRGVRPTWHAWARKVRARVSTLIVPYVLWNGGAFVFFALCQRTPGLSRFFARPENQVASLSWWQRVDMLLGVTRDPVQYQFWFVRDLFVLVLASHVLAQLVRHTRGLILVALLALWCGVAPEVPLYVSREALLFFCAGLGLAQLSGASLALPRGRVVAAAYLVSGLFEATWLAHRPEGLANLPVPGLLWHQANVLVGIVALWTLASDIAESTSPVAAWLCWAGVYSFFVFAAHEPLLSVLKKLGHAAVGHETDAQRLSVYLGTASLTISATLIMGISVRKALPRAYQYLTGGRGV